jgi:hypothetical protein
MAQEERLPAGTRIGLYRIESFVSRDPAASRYRARQETLDRDVILAVAAAPLGSAEGDGFYQRAQRLIDLDHPRIRRVLDAGSANGKAYAVLAKRAGRALTDEHSLPPEQAAEVVRQLASASEALASSGIDLERLSTSQIAVAGTQSRPEVRVDALGAAAPGDPDTLTTSPTDLARLMARMSDREPSRPLRSVLKRAESYPSASSFAEAAASAAATRRSRKSPLVAAAAVLAVALASAVIVLGREEDRSGRPLAAADAPAARVAASIPLGDRPGALGFGDHSAWVHTVHGKLLHIDTRRGQVVGRPVSLGPHFAPTAIAVGGGSVWTSVGGTLVRVDAARHRVTARLHLGPGILGISYARRQVWVGVSSPPGVEPVVNQLVRIEPTTMRRVGRPFPVGNSPAAIHLRGQNADVLNANAGTVTSVDTTNGRSRTLRVSAQIAFGAPLGHVLWLPSPVDGTVVAADMNSRQLSSTVVRPGQAFGVAALGGAVWATAYESRFPQPGRVRLVRIDPHTHRLAGRPLELGRDASLPVAGDGALWVASGERRALLKVTPTSPPPRPAAGPPHGEGAQRLQSGPLAQGEWRTALLRPPLRMTIREPHWLASLAPGFIGLARSDLPDLFVSIAAPRQVLGDHDQPEPARSVSDVIRALRANPRLHITAQRPIDLGGLRATRLDVGVRRTRHIPAVCGPQICAPIFPFPGGTYLLGAANDNRVYVAAAGGRVVISTVEVPHGSPASQAASAERVVQSLRVGGD